LAGAIILLRALRGVLAGLEFHPDQVALAVAAVTLAAIVACWLPSRRATRVDPVAALRCE
jgi:ABC-type lipoprotein release transport system permease subunit